jgi:pantoate--beta-alanine ligase
MNVEIVVCPIVREADGVALSSRNIYLNEEEREQAAVLNRSLQLVQEAYWKGEKSVEVLTELIVSNINQMPLAEIDYADIYAYPSLKTIAKVEEKAIAAVAVKFGKTRLIDNIILEKRK